MAIKSAKQEGKSIRIYLFVFIATIVTLFFVWTRLQNIRIKREIVKLSVKEKKINFENNQLKLQWARLTDPKRLEKIGVKEFKLRYASPEQIVKVK